MSLQEAELEVLSWLDPSRAPSIEWSVYARGADIAKNWLEWRPDLIDSRASYRVDPLDLPPNAAMIAASTGGIDHKFAEFVIRDSRELPSACASAGDDSRECIVAVFDAVSAVATLVTFVGSCDSGIIDSLRPASVPEVVHIEVTPSVTPSRQDLALPTGGPTVASPNGATGIVASGIPDALKPTFESYPLLPGTRWTWKATERIGGVRWSTAVVTETVVAAWAVAEDVVAVHSLVEWSSTFESLSRRMRWELQSGSKLRYVTPDGIYADELAAEERKLADQRRVGRGWANEEDYGAEPIDFAVVPLEASIYPIEGGSEFVPGIAVVASDVVVSASAGEFHGCYVIEEIGGGGWGIYWWFCPGEGYVRSEHWGCSGSGAGVTVLDLESYELP